LTAGGERFQITYAGGTGNDVVLTHVNTAPVLDPIPDQTVLEGDTLNVTAHATDVDAPPDVLTFSLDPGAPSGASIDPATGAFSWTAPRPGAGTYSVTVRVTDAGSPPLSDARTFQIVVKEANRPPTADPAGPTPCPRAAP
jgi:hypothetical protein